MRRKQRPNRLISVALVLVCTVASLAGFAAADMANVPSLVISQLKITSGNGQFVTLYNPSNAAIDMSKYQLEYFNSYDLSKATSSRLISLSGTVPPHGYYMVNDSALMLCYQLTVDSVSLGLSSTAGMVEVLAFSQLSPGGSVVPVLQDYVGWSKTTATGAQTLPTNTSAFLMRQPVDNGGNPVVDSAGTGNWQTVQPDPNNACNLVTATGFSSVTSGLSQLLPPTEPPATIVNLAEPDINATPTIPAADIGLTAPTITELLPNPDGTGNDSTDEYIELYNPNSKTFDLSGFTLQTGTKTFRNYTLPSGTSLPPQSFTAFYSETTGLSLSNTGSQAKLLDPLGNSISASDVYGTAKDGQAWAKAKGKWYWTTAPTPNAANVIKQPMASKKSGTKTKSKTTPAKSNSSKPVTTSSYSNSAETTPVHTWTLALVVGVAILYALYEYRSDLANRVFQLRQYLRARRGYRA
jgi:hypothetical protein